jgi:leucyl-tRNA synthetase
MNPFMPHLAQELWELIGERTELTFEKWPTYNKELILSDEIIIPIQINGKRRSEISISVEQSEDEVIKKAKSDDKIASYLTNATIVKEIYIKGKILNIVIKQ